ncbi:type II toxin-antitoxin system HipA family toxin [Hoeflea olei]|nr:type II toxin-antitoxin system HipA family toxin [Hoeflea olei]
MRGIYVDADADANAEVLRHSIRIANYLYPRAYLSAASAVLLAPTRDGRLFVSGPRNQRTRIRTLEIVQNVAPGHPALATATIDDGLGEFHANVSSIRQRFLEAFRMRSEHASSIDEAMRADIAQRLIAEYGDPRAAADALWVLARENEWYREGELAERYLLREPVEFDFRNEAALDFIVAWHGTTIGHLLHDGFEWRWKADTGFGLPLIQQRVPGKLPPFVLSLLPEGWLERILKQSDERAMLRSGRRYMSNITIGTTAAELEALPADLLVGRLANFTAGGLFTGTYTGPGRGTFEQSFEEKLARLYASAGTPRLSGVQIKAPMFLGEDGILVPGTHLPFTHILKPAGTSGFQALPVVEFLALALGRHAGLDTPPSALTEMPDGMAPALIVERFDIRISAADPRLLALEDLCSVLDLPPEAKYDGTIERIARAIRPLATDPEADLLLVLKRALFAWLIADGDMHLKNLALLKIARPGTGSFEKVGLAPLYDAVTTTVFPGLDHDRMALKINGKDNRLRRDDFVKMAAVAGLTAKAANQAIEDLLAGLRAGLDALTIPDIPGLDDEIVGTAERMIATCRQRVGAFE